MFQFNWGSRAAAIVFLLFQTTTAPAAKNDWAEGTPGKSNGATIEKRVTV